MIFFCEDCGKKNILVPEQVKDGKAVFRCEGCHYMNSYAVTLHQDPGIHAAASVLKGLCPFPEIIGSFLFHREKGILKNYMPPSLKETDLNTLGKLLAENVSVCRSLFPDVNEMAVFISDKTMTLKMINKHLAVIIAGKTYPLPQRVMDHLALLESTAIPSQEKSK